MLPKKAGIAGLFRERDFQNMQYQGWRCRARSHAVVQDAQHVDAWLAIRPESHEMAAMPTLSCHMQHAYAGRQVVALFHSGDVGAIGQRPHGQCQSGGIDTFLLRAEMKTYPDADGRQILLCGVGDADAPGAHQFDSPSAMTQDSSAAGSSKVS